MNAACTAASSDLPGNSLIFQASYYMEDCAVLGIRVWAWAKVWGLALSRPLAAEEDRLSKRTLSVCRKCIFSCPYSRDLLKIT